jgi:hypothetical protein
MKLNREEEKFISDLMRWNAKHKPLSFYLYNIFLLLGGVIIVVDIIMTIPNLTDKFIFQFTIPVFILGFLMIGLYIFGSYWMKERKIISAILNKLINK